MPAFLDPVKRPSRHFSAPARPARSHGRRPAWRAGWNA